MEFKDDVSDFNFYDKQINTIKLGYQSSKIKLEKPRELKVLDIKEKCIVTAIDFVRKKSDKLKACEIETEQIVEECV